MITLTTTDALAAFCARARAHPYITVDTEFLRERTYYAQLCLVQLALPGEAEEDAVLVDPIEGDVALDPLYELFRDRSVIKVFHAARQDLEIFYVDGEVLPDPLFDTQVAAMVCGFGEQVGYETLVKKIAGAALDKSSRFTDWSRRPLSEAQKVYALADVTHLRTIYEVLSVRLAEQERTAWVDEEIAELTRPETYITLPDEAWQRVRTRPSSTRFMALVKALAAFRERHAQTKNIPRNRIFKDDALLELASAKPTTPEAFGSLRLLTREARRGEIAEGIVAAVQEGMEMPAELAPKPDRSRDKLAVNPALADLLRVLLKAKADEAGVAQKLIATTGDLDRIAAGERGLPCLSGWRGQVFGADALRLCEGEIALAAEGQKVRTLPI